MDFQFSDALLAALELSDGVSIGWATTFVPGAS